MPLDGLSPLGRERARERASEAKSANAESLKRHAGGIQQGGESEGTQPDALPGPRNPRPEIQNQRPETRRPEPENRMPQEEYNKAERARARDQTTRYPRVGAFEVWALVPGRANPSTYVSVKNRLTDLCGS